tara:strand:- start:1203 stop:1499 length:297 start_codon:yes stop_codon:yes gene_type:complete
MSTTDNIDIEIIDFLDLINTTLSPDFIEKWKYRYSEKFVKLFQVKILDSMSSSKPIKIKNLYTYLTKKCKYSSEQVVDFFEQIDITIYYPLVQGKLSL